MARLFVLFAALSAFFAVGLGAFAAHGLKAQLTPAALGTFQTGVNYQFYHALAVLGIAALLYHRPSPWLTAAGNCFMIGTLLFSGSLYLLALDGPRWLGPITPSGGVFFLCGWLCLFIASWKLPLR
jgi:uncharacterized membrane protein YgdD (TMEM256/DUF423 family)